MKENGPRSGSKIPIGKKQEKELWQSKKSREAIPLWR